MRRLLKNEQGVALVMAVAFMALALPLVIAALHLASALTVDSRVKKDILNSQYSSLGGNQYGLYLLAYQPGFAEAIPVGTPTSTTVTLNGQTVTVNLVKAAEAPSPTPPKAVNSRRLRVFLGVTPTTTAPSTPTTYTYTITVDNRDDETEQVTKLHDLLPSGFSYVLNTAQFAPPSGGPSSIEPSISGQQLTWNLSPLSVSLEPAEFATLTFDATASVAEGAYCDEAWAEPGGLLTSTGKTAAVTVGSPVSTLCDGAAVRLTKTVFSATSVFGAETTHTYTITIENTGTSDLNISQIRDFLPGCTDPCSVPTDAFEYQLVSTGGDITTNDPNRTTVTQKQGDEDINRQRLDWNFSPDFLIPSGQTKTLTFDAKKGALAIPAEKWNEVLVSIDEFGSDPVYSWPTAPVSVKTIVITCADDGKSSVASEVWVGIGDADVQWLEFVQQICP